jgi:primosomal protein N' (replication factor Y)
MAERQSPLIPEPPARPRAEGPVRRVAVLLPMPLGEAYDYRLPEDMAVDVGAFVTVPLGRRTVTGVVWGPGTGAVGEEKLRPVEAVLDAPKVPAVSRRFVDWVAGYTLSPPGAVLRMVMSVPAALEPAKPTVAYRAAEAPPAEVRVTAARRRVLDVLADGFARPAADLAREAGCGSSVIKQMAEAGLLEAVDLPPPPAFDPPDPARPGPTLTADQATAAAALADQVRAAVPDSPGTDTDADGGGEGGFSVGLLDGVTGSGKTEVYFEAVAAALESGRQALVLLPEIALSAQWLDRFEARFGCRPAEWHSELTPAQRRTTWRAVAEGQARVVVGARSALYLPYPALGLIVVDEEHEGAFKQEDGVVYHARDMAVVRAHLGRIPVILSSATPSVERTVNVEAGRYARLALPDRHGGAALPSVAAIDLRGERLPADRFLSGALLHAVSSAISAGEQAMLFLNRRGYAPLTLCRACGHRLECPHCAAWLVEHRLAGRLICHHCGFTARRPATCPTCEADDSFAACGPGVERIAEEVDRVLPGARWTIVASDTLTGPRQAAAFVEQVNRGEVDLLIGTQIVAKGYHFPRLTLVGVVDADLGFSGGDFRAFERTYQMLHQVSGRAGRAEHPGRVLLQTWEPENPVIQALVRGDRDGFVARQIDDRRRGGWPPFGRLAALIVSGPDRDRVEEAARQLGRTAPRGEGIEVFGPAEAPLGLLRGRFRRRLLVKATRRAPLQKTVAAWLDAVTLPSNVRVTVDIDPYSFL